MANEPREKKRCTQAAESPDGCELDSSGYHETQHITSSRAQRHANANLLSPLRNEITQKTVNPGGGEAKRDPRKYTEQPDLKAARSRHLFQNARYCLHCKTRNLPVCRPDRLPYRVFPRGAIVCAASHEDVHIRGPRCLAIRPIESRDDLTAWPIRIYISDDPDHVQPFRF